MRKTAALLVLALLASPLVASAQSLHFRMTTSLYNWERFDTDSTTSKHLRLYQLGSFDVSRLFGKKNLSIHAYLGYSSDFGQRAGNDPQNLLYHAYLDWKNLPGKGWIRLGRQRIFAGVGFGTLDGLSARFSVLPKVDILAYAGLLAPALNDARLEKWEDSHMIGGQFRATPLKGFQVAVSYVRRNRLPLRYRLPGRFTEERLTFQSLQNELFGVDLRYSGLKNGTLYGRLDYDLGLRGIRRMDLRGNFRLGRKWQVGASLIHRTPYTNLNSIFSVFTQYGYDEYMVNLRYQVGTELALTSQLGARVYHGDNGLVFGAGVYWKNQYFGYFHRSGYEGLGDNLIVQSNIFLRQKLSLLFGANLFSYQLAPDFEAERTLALAGNAGLNYRPSSWLNLDFQLQTLHNERYNSDIRFFFRATYWYFKRR